jgi:hypothetical protein
MNKSQIKSQFSVERNEANEVVYFNINGWNKNLEPIFVPFDRDQCTSTVYAGLDFLRHELYNHPQTKVGFHRKVRKFAKVNMSPFHQDYAGAISINFVPDKDFVIPVPKQTEFHRGWAKLAYENNIYTLEQPDDPYAFGTKHNRIDMLIAGYGFRIGVPRFLARPKEGNPDSVAWVELMIDQWTTTDDLEAWTKRNTRINAFLDREAIYEPIAQAKENGGLTSEDVMGVGPSTAVILFDTNEPIPLEELALGRYRVYNKANPVDVLRWDGGLEAKARIATIVKRNFKLRPIS